MYEWLWNITCFLSLFLGALANVRLSLRGPHQTPRSTP